MGAGGTFTRLDLGQANPQLTEWNGRTSDLAGGEKKDHYQTDGETIFKSTRKGRRLGRREKPRKSKGNKTSTFVSINRKKR